MSISMKEYENMQQRFTEIKGYKAYGLALRIYEKLRVLTYHNDSLFPVENCPRMPSK